MTNTDPRTFSPNYLGFDSITWYVGNALQASSFFVTRLGFEVIAYRGPTTSSYLVSSYVVSNGSAVMLFMAPIRGPEDIADLRASEEDHKLLKAIHSHLTKHGDGVKDIAFRVVDVQKVWEYAMEHGAQSIQNPKELKEDGLGKVRFATISAYGDTTHSLVDRTEYRGIFWPGYHLVTLPDPVNKILPNVDFVEIDHCVGNQPWNGLETTIK